MRAIRFPVATTSAILGYTGNSLMQQARRNQTATADEASPQTNMSSEEGAAVPPPPQRKRFSPVVQFKISPEKVDSDNCPTASEIKELLPSADELKQQLPTHAEIRAMYGLDRPGAGRAPPTPEIYANQGVMASLKRTVLGALSKDSDLNKDGDGNVSAPAAADGASGNLGKKSGLGSFFDRFSLHPDATTQGVPHAMSANNAKSGNGKDAANTNNRDEDEPLWADCDTPEDILNEERYGGEGEEAPKPTGEHVTLAWKALLYGTVLATLMTFMAGAAMCGYMGFSSMAEIKEHLQNRKQREIDRLKKDALAEREKRREQRKREALDRGVYDLAAIDADDEDDVNGGDGVHVYEIDLTQPTTLMSQLDGLMKLIEDVAARESEKEEAASDKKAQVSTGQQQSFDFSTSASAAAELPPKPAAKRSYSL